MYLKKISMENFKSFGKEIEIPVKKGYTNITGPNGSGKSNIGDAILFVLGPKSSKEIRAGRLTDLIFNGGKKDDPADYCKVSLTFDNQDQKIPMDEEEITFTRRVQRSDNQQGYNSYFYINGRSSTLTEFQDLLTHARISPDGYNVVQQGDIAKIVDMSDQERRKILDDISGISDYDKEIDDAEDKKEGVDEDLKELNAVLKEVKNKVDELEDDRKHALKYQELSDEVSEAKKKKMWKKKKQKEKEIVSIQEDIEEHEQQFEEIKEKKSSIKNDIQDIKDDIEDVEEEIDSKTDGKGDELQEQINEVKLERAKADDRKDEAKSKIERFKDERERLKDKLSDAKEGLSDVKNELREKKEEKDEKEGELEGIQEKIEGTKEKQSDSGEGIQELRKEGIEVKNKIDDKNETLSEKSVELDRKRDKVDRLEEDIAELEEEKEEIEFEKKEAEWNLEEKQDKKGEKDEELKELKDEFHEEKNKQKRLREDKEDLEDRVNRLNRKYKQLKAQEKAAKSVKKGYSNAVSSILGARDKGDIDGIHGTIAELADVDDKYETALQVAAGGRMQSIVVEDDEVASKSIKHLKKNNAGRASFLPLNKMREGRPKGKAIKASKDSSAVDFAIELVDYDDEYENVFWYVFQDTVVMKDIDSARQNMGGVRMVTLDGEKIERSGAMVGGTLKKNMMGFSTPDRGEIDRVGDELKSTRDNLNKVTSELKEKEKKIQEIQDKIDKLHAEGGDKHEIKSLTGKIDSAEKKLEKKEKSLEEKREEKEETEEEVEKLEDSISFLKEKIDELKDERKEIDEKIQEISPEKLTKKLNELQEEEVELSKAINKLGSQIKQREDEKERFENDIEEHKERRKELKKKIKDKKAEIKKKEKKIEEKTNELKGLKERHSSMSEEIEELRDKKEELTEERIELRHKLDELDTKFEGNKDYVRTQKQKLSTLEDNLQELKEDMGEDVDFSDEDIPSMKELKHTIRRGEEKMEDLQPVNMRAIENYKEEKERRDDLQERLTELQDRKEELNNLIDELDEKKKIGLNEVKGEINENFKEVYNDLSNGGEAHLELENSESPFDGGLIIKARPPGKKVHRIQALSGGEKSLVSMAFIFAIQKYDPSPFYLLDEIDQNLDGVNAENVAEMIKRNSRSAQFIQVSLRKVTLKKSDHIIGVTIHENGISEVIMRVNIGQDDDDPEDDLPDLSSMAKMEPEV